MKPPNSTRTHHWHRRSFRPLLELLEVRTNPTCIVNQVDLDSNGIIDLQIIGDLNDQNLIIIQNQTAGTTTVSLDCSGDGDFDDADDLNAQVFNTIFETFDIQLRGGNDSVLFQLDSDLDSAANFIVARLGGGTNSFTFNANGNLINNAQLSIHILSGVLNDQVSASFNGIVDSSVALRGDLSAGMDGVDIDFNDSITANSMVDVDFDLGSGADLFNLDVIGNVETSFLMLGLLTRGGADQLTVNVTGNALNNARVDLEMAMGAGGNLLNLTADGDILTGAELNVDVDSRHGQDQVNLFVSSFVEAELNIAIAVDRGNDTVTADLDVDEFGVGTTGRAFFKVKGGLDDDTINFQATGAGTANVDGFLDFRLLGGPGNDMITLDLGDSGSDKLDLGATARFRLRVKGHIGNDFFFIQLATTATSTGDVDILGKGGNGDDLFTLAVFDATFDAVTQTSQLSFGAAGRIVFNAGRGVDTGALFGPLVGVPLLQILNTEL